MTFSHPPESLLQVNVNMFDSSELVLLLLLGRYGKIEERLKSKVSGLDLAVISYLKAPFPHL